MLSAIEHRHGRLLWSWNKARPRGAKLRQGTYLLRTNLDPMDPDVLWRQYVQLTEVEAAFRALKSDWPSARSGTASSAASRPIS